MKTRSVPLFLSVSVLAGVMAVGGSAAASPLCHPDLKAIATPHLRKGSELAAVVAISKREAWAVGNQGAGARTLREHWDGRTWTVVPGPDPGQGNTLEAVDGTSSSDVWAVGATFDGVSDHGLIQHWDGAQWVLSPNPAGAGLTGVAVLSPTDAWAVGEAQTILHWDGVAWSNVTHLPLEEADLHAVSAVSADDVWFVGAVAVEGGGENTLALHWDGSLVTNVTTDIPDGASALNGVTALAPDDVWAVGVQEDLVSRTVIEHWDGVVWTQVHSPNRGPEENELRGVSALSPTDIWAVGGFASEEIQHPLVVHWNGSSWRTVEAEEPVPTDEVVEFNAVSARTTQDIWAVGAHGPIVEEVTPLIENVQGCR